MQEQDEEQPLKSFTHIKASEKFFRALLLNGIGLQQTCFSAKY